jgi:hypothetical protein
MLVVGAGRAGAVVLRQLQKNPDIEILTVDPRQRPLAVEEGLIPAVDVEETLTPLTLEYVLERTHPDLVLLTTDAEDLALGLAPGMDVLHQSLREELAAISPVPVLIVSRSVI